MQRVVQDLEPVDPALYSGRETLGARLVAVGLVCACIAAVMMAL